MLFSISGEAESNQTYHKQTGDSNILEFAAKKRNSNVFNDVLLKAGTEIFRANKLILSYHSLYFEEKLSTYDDQTGVYPVSLPVFCDAASLKSLIEYFYSNRININTDNVCDLLVASNLLRINDVRAFCFIFLKQTISYTSCFEIYGMAIYYKDKSLEDHAVKFIERNFEAVTNSSSFVHVKLEDMVTCLPQLRRDHVTEARIYEAILVWTKYDRENRAEDFLKLFQLLDLNRLPSKHLLAIAQEENLFQEDSILTKSFNDIYKICLQRNRAKTNDTRIISLGGKKTEAEVMCIFEYLTKYTREKYPDLPEERNGGCAIESNSNIWYIGGRDLAGKANRNVWVMKLQQSDLKWKTIESMNEERASMAATIFDKSLVVVGGISGRNKILHSCECYMEVNKWQNTSPLINRRNGHALVVCQDALYAFGGYDGKSALSSVEQLRGINQEWKSACSMNTPRRDLTAVNCDDTIYAIGGSTDKEKTSLKTAEKYDVKTNMWSYISDMNFARSWCSSCVFQGRIFVVGGVDAEGKVVHAIEFYDPLTDKWTIGSKVEKELISSSIVAI